MKKITFITGKFKKEIFVTASSNLLKIIHDNNLFIDAPCAGNGSCGKCYVEINSRQELACCVTVNNDMLVKIPEYNNFSQDDKNEFKKILRSDKINSLIKKVEINAALNERINYQSDFDFFTMLLKEKGFKIKPPGKIGLLNKISALTHNSGIYTVFLFDEEIIDIIDKSNLKNIGLAIDVGTTTVSVAAIDVENGDVIDTISFYNPQIMFGADVINRIIFANKNGGDKILKDKLVHELKESINFLCSRNSILEDEIKSAAVSGNTTMMHLLFGINSKFIREIPYSPVVKTFPVFDAAETVDIIKTGKIFIFPCPSNYLGGDLVSGAVACAFNNKNGINILLDIGTNGEIIVGNKEWIMGCACSAGPAFEGMGLNCGTRFREGAIYEAEYINDNFSYKTAGNVKPSGISGTGIISLIKVLKEHGFVDNRGKFTDKIDTLINNKKAFILFNENQTQSNMPIYINEIDIDNILRAKAAIYSGINLILKKLDLFFTDVENLFIAGGIGNSLNLDNAIKIGLLPPLDKNKIKFAGNSSLIGAGLYLVSENARLDVQKIINITTYIDLSNELLYMDEFMAALFIPHTDLDLFKDV